MESWNNHGIIRTSILIFRIAVLQYKTLLITYVTAQLALALGVLHSFVSLAYLLCFC